jgi:hypothetical protein
LNADKNFKLATTNWPAKVAAATHHDAGLDVTTTEPPPQNLELPKLLAQIEKRQNGFEVGVVDIL